ncbi:MAG: N-acetyl-gamma-glutamyl-phosphate reductase [Desulfobacterales bacterium]|jgi:N-acetyl-gamma-glutamyl-phosphate reductase|nr:N-acetyl-gamma-glutamyl-phosphate reductase [Desulfobacteraceae bacterium]MDY0311613.1 N-acetyl-gamma-glutamyl-phosphate reductase [Desulfobacterales bacterium]
MTRVAVVGATGYAGAELVRILAGHPAVTLTRVTSRQYAGVPFADVFPALSGRVELICRAFDPRDVIENADIIFTALPHKVPMAIVPDLVAAGRRVIDLSADFRFRNVDLYESVYQPHQSRDLCGQTVYGLCEVYAESITGAQLVGNPGCYPTSVLLPLIPLLRQGLVAPEGLVADSKSGVSGAGRGASLTTHICEVAESFKPYKVAAHRHNPEMEAILEEQAGRPVSLTFVPHLVPMSRGMQTTIYARPVDGVDEAAIRDCLSRFYAGRPFVRLRPTGKAPDTRHVRGTNYCDIGMVLDDRRHCLVLMSAIDNLVKGAAGQAVQNMNLMLGFAETTGLDQVPYPV